MIVGPKDPPRGVFDTLWRLGAFHAEARARGHELVDSVTRFYQAHAGLQVDGAPGPITESAATADLIVASRADRDWAGFSGSLGLLVQWEGHAGRPYWPAAQSGLTLDPGFDLRWHSADELAELYGPILKPGDLEALELAIGMGPLLARELVHDPLISRIRISRVQAARLLPRIASPYWLTATRMLRGLERSGEGVPGAVQSAALSLCYNAGPNDLAALRPSFEARDWNALAGVLEQIPKIPRRRRAEAALIRAWL